MKLLKKTQIYFLTLLVILLIVWSGIFLFAISQVLKDSIDESLYSELEVTIRQFHENDAASFLDYAKYSPLLDYTFIDSLKTDELFYSDTLLYNSVEKEEIPYRQVHAEVLSSGRPVRITLRKSMIEYDDLFSAILITELLLIIMLIAGMYLLNRIILGKVWQPFFGTLQKASGYRINQKELLNLPETDIHEFAQLNNVLKDMMHKIEQDYQSLKKFTENASHEIQTPLSVITTKIEVMLQDEQFDENQWRSFKDIFEAANRISRINKALLLLTKIENRQFNDEQSIYVSEVLVKLLGEFEDRIKQKNISLTKEISKSVVVSGSEELFDILLRNLIVNAIRHNNEDGEITIELFPKKLVIGNTGTAPDQDISAYFDRFKKNSNNPDSLGLGLSIVKEICTISNYGISYRYENKFHIIEVSF